MLNRVLRILMLVLVSSAMAAQSAPQPEFALKFDDHGITSLKRVGDKYDTDYIAQDATLGHVVIRYKMGENEWREFSTRDPKNKLDKLRDDRSPRVSQQLSVIYNPQDWREKQYYADLELTERFRAEHDALYWTIFVRNPTHKPIVLGDIFLPLPFNSSMRWDKEITYHERVVRHEYISGNGSFVYWMRPTGEGPYLVMTPVSKCPLFEPTRSEMNFAPGKLEYSDRGGVYILSGRRGEEDRAKGGNWRQPQTTHTLAPTNSQRDGITYAFKFSWAKDYDGVRQILYEEGVPDVHVVPGMTVPLGTEAMISIRSREPMRTLEPEFPPSTEIRNGESSVKDTRVYKVKFSKLGENKITLHYGKDQYSVLEFFVTEPISTLIKKRAEFLVTHQQHRDSSKWYNGLFSEWDMKDKVLRSPDDTGGLADYILASDDPALCKPVYLAAKNAVYPDPKEIAALEYYLQNFVWGKLQMSTEEEYPYAVYGIDNWKINRDSKPADRSGWTKHIWRAYDYPHIVMLYWNMYLIARHYPELVHYLTADQYLERAYGTALAFYTYPWEIAHWSANELGNYNELEILNVIRELDRVGKHDQAATLRKKWNEKVEYFVNDQPDLFYSEYPFDPTAFESTGAFAHYALRQVNLTSSTLKVTKADAERFTQEQLACNMATRGVLAPNYWQLGVEGNMRYMSQMGGWSILDYGLYFAKDPFPYLRLGYASLLSSWALMNTGTPESNYGYWYPGKENDGAAGSAYVPQAYGSNWFGKSQPRGAWQYSGEIDLGFGAALRTAAVIVVNDPIFGRFAYGGDLQRQGEQNTVIPEDGVRRRFHIIENKQRVHIQLGQDGFAAGAPIAFDDKLRGLSFRLENRDPDHKAHSAELRVSGFSAAYAVIVGGSLKGTIPAGPSITTIELPLSTEGASVVLRRANAVNQAQGTLQIRNLQNLFPGL
ncbi:MAG TPA: DUF5695 domain-containing protein [Terriglobales bacterium]|nr:DUF5695 domain-containing protein [Terriglobales bacterium]